ncbi:hypothetical protein EUX98_g3680 [Antrodiella citrinella]|uniref:Uncharacterized protein n=1 Tax=Antrodiella citrinella TaxID=2447956 RepID=A0A4S4MYF5_9APHY|nr:hypothetical protein EUX98_g3680 [Antrodiella citrinella]
MEAITPSAPCRTSLDRDVAKFFVLLPLSLVALCILEESLESDILNGLFVLVLDIFISLLRIPILLLSCLGLCHLSVAARIRESTVSLLQSFGVRSSTDVKVSHLEGQVASLSDELSKSRANAIEVQTQSMRLQTKLSQAQRETQKLRRKAAAEHIAETTRLQEALEIAQDGCDDLRREKEALAVDQATEIQGYATRNAALRREFNTEKADLRTEIKDVKAQWRKEVSEITSQRDDLRRLCLEHQTQTLAIQTHYSSVEDDMQSARRKLASIQDRTRLLEAMRYHNIKDLLLGLLVLWRFSHVLGLRLSDALRVKAVLLLRFKTLSSQKVEARQAYLRVQNLNQDLQALLDAEVAKCTEETASSRKWHAEYYKSVKARDRAAVKFKTFQRFAVERFSSTATKLLTSLLILWRQNTILSAHLAETRALARALQISAAEADETLAAAAADDEAFHAENLHPHGFSMLSRNEANAVYAIQYRKYSQAIRDYQQFVESCSTAVSAPSDDSERKPLQESYDGLKDLHEKVVLERDDALSTMETLKAEHRDLQVRLGHASKEHRAVIHQLEDAQTLVCIKEEEYRVQSSASAHDLDKTQERVRSLEGRCSSQDQRIEALQAKLVEVEERRTSIDSTVKSLQNRLTESKDMQAEYEGENQTLKYENRDLNLQFHNAKDEARELRERNSAMETEYRQHAGLLDAQVIEIRKKLQRSISDAGVLQDRIADLEDNRRSLEGHIAELQKEVADARTQLRHAQTVYDQMRTHLQAQIKRMDVSTLEANSQLFDTRKRAQDLTKIVSNLERRQADLERELSTSMDSLKVVQSQLKSKLEGLEKELSATTESAHKTRSQLQSELTSQLQTSSETQFSLVVALAILYASQKEDRARWTEVAGKARSMDEHIGRLKRTFELLNSLDVNYRRLLVNDSQLPQVALSRTLACPGISASTTVQPPAPIPLKTATAPSLVGPSAPMLGTPGPSSDVAFSHLGPQATSTPRRRRGSRGSGISHKATSGGVRLGPLARIVKTPKMSSSPSMTDVESGSSFHQPMSRRARRRARTASASILLAPGDAMPAVAEAPQEYVQQEIRTVFQPAGPRSSICTAIVPVSAVPSPQPLVRNPQTTQHPTTVARSVMQRAIQARSPVIPSIQPVVQHRPTHVPTQQRAAPRLAPPLTSLPDDDVDVFRPAIREALAELHGGAHSYRDGPVPRSIRRPTHTRPSTQGWQFTPPRHEFNTAGASPVNPFPVEQERLRAISVK